jgi:hypothetical protein
MKPLSIALASLLRAASAGAQTKLLRFPDVHGERVADPVKTK